MKENYAYILDERSFYDFWIILHQVSPIKINAKEEDYPGLFEEMVKILKGKYKILTVEELKEILEINDRFKINNMILKLERDNHGIQL